MSMPSIDWQDRDTGQLESIDYWCVKAQPVLRIAECTKCGWESIPAEFPKISNIGDRHYAECATYEED